MSHIMCSLCKVLKIQHLHTTVYHPQTNGLVDQFNGTLKNMLHRCTQEKPWKWDLLVPPLLFTVRGVL